MLNIMKKTIVSAISVILSVVCILCLVSCAEKVDATGLWESATYLSDTTLGKGEKTVSFTVEVEEQIITITLKTDKATVKLTVFSPLPRVVSER